MFQKQYLKTHLELYGGNKTSINDEKSAAPNNKHERPSENSIESEAWDDIPELESVYDSDDDDNQDTQWGDEMTNGYSNDKKPWDTPLDASTIDNNFEELFESSSGEMREAFAQRIAMVLTHCQPFPGDGAPIDPSYTEGKQRFTVERLNTEFFAVYDRVQGFDSHIHVSRVRWKSFSIGKWFSERCAINSEICYPWDRAHQWMLTK